MNNVLQDICARTAMHVTHQKQARPLQVLQDEIAQAGTPRGFIKALRDAPGPAIIAEIKKASPSRGIIREDFNPAEIAKIYQDGGATCLSVLTDVHYFHGSDENLRAARAATTLPVLRKDFMIDPYQIYESRAMGADCVLLIMAALEDEQAKELYDLAVSLEMDVLVEVHNAPELERARALKPAMIGVNNRNLKTLNVDLQTGFDVMEKMPADILAVAESGISDPRVLLEFYTSGYKGFLIGEYFMREANVAAAMKKLIDTNRELN